MTALSPLFDGFFAKKRLFILHMFTVVRLNTLIQWCLCLHTKNNRISAKPALFSEQRHCGASTEIKVSVVS